MDTYIMPKIGKLYDGEGIVETTLKKRGNQLPPSARAYLKKYGNEEIVDVRIERVPLGKLQSALTAIVYLREMLTKFKTPSNIPHDDLFHLQLVIKTTRGKDIMIGKEEVIRITEDLYKGENMETRNLGKPPKAVSLSQFVENTAKMMGDKFAPYNAFNNNCQDFVMAMLQANGMGSPEDFAFIKQDTMGLFKGRQWLIDMLKGATDLAGAFNVLIEGAGKITEKYTPEQIERRRRQNRESRARMKAKREAEAPKAPIVPIVETKKAPKGASLDAPKAPEDKARAKAEKDAIKAREKAMKDAEKARIKAEKEAIKAREKAMKDAEKARIKSEKEAIKAREKAMKEAEAKSKAKAKAEAETKTKVESNIIATRLKAESTIFKDAKAEDAYNKAKANPKMWRDLQDQIKPSPKMDRTKLRKWVLDYYLTPEQRDVFTILSSPSDFNLMLNVLATMIRDEGTWKSNKDLADFMQNDAKPFFTKADDFIQTLRDSYFYLPEGKSDDDDYFPEIEDNLYYSNLDDFDREDEEEVSNMYESMPWSTTRDIDSWITRYENKTDAFSAKTPISKIKGMMDSMTATLERVGKILAVDKKDVFDGSGIGSSKVAPELPKAKPKAPTVPTVGRFASFKPRAFRPNKFPRSVSVAPALAKIKEVAFTTRAPKEIMDPATELIKLMEVWKSLPDGSDERKKIAKQMNEMYELKKLMDKKKSEGGALGDATSQDEINLSRVYSQIKDALDDEADQEDIEMLWVRFLDDHPEWEDQEYLDNAKSEDVYMFEVIDFIINFIQFVMASYADQIGYRLPQYLRAFVEDDTAREQLVNAMAQAQQGGIFEGEGIMTPEEVDGNVMNGGFNLRPPFCRAGNKYPVKDLILSQIPEHTTYVEPFAGSSAIFFNKPKADRNVLNDLDTKMINNLKLIKNAPKDPAIWDSLPKLKPRGGRDEKATRDALDVEIFMKRPPKNIVEKLMQAKINNCAGYSGTPVKGNPPRYYNVSEQPTKRIETYLDLYKAFLKDVKLTSEDYERTIKANDSKSTFFFIDPPYENTSATLEYAQGKQFDFQRLSQVLGTIKGKFLMTINDSPNTRSIFKQFNITPFKAPDSWFRGKDKPKAEVRKEIFVRNY